MGYALEKDEEQPRQLALKFNENKAPVSLIPAAAIIEEAFVMAHGMEKYGRDNWRKGLPWSHVIDAAFRHLLAFQDGEDFDPESRMHHLGHLRCCAAFLIEYSTTHPELDDRPKVGRNEHET